MLWGDKSEESFLCILFIKKKTFFISSLKETIWPISVVMEVNSKFQHQASETLPGYVNPDQMSDISNIRLRHIEVDILSSLNGHCVFPLLS